MQCLHHRCVIQKPLNCLLHSVIINIVIAAVSMPLHCFPLCLMRALLSMGENIRMHMSPQPLGLIPKYQVIIFVQSAHVASDHHSLKDLHCLLTTSSHLMQTFN